MGALFSLLILLPRDAATRGVCTYLQLSAPPLWGGPPTPPPTPEPACWAALPVTPLLQHTSNAGKKSPNCFLFFCFSHH